MRDGNSSVPTGFIPDLLEKLAQIVNIEYEFVWEERYGSRDPDGTWTGLVGLATSKVNVYGSFHKVAS